MFVARWTRSYGANRKPVGARLAGIPPTMKNKRTTDRRGLIFSAVVGNSERSQSELLHCNWYRRNGASKLLVVTDHGIVSEVFLKHATRVIGEICHTETLVSLDHYLQGFLAALCTMIGLKRRSDPV